MPLIWLRARISMAAESSTQALLCNGMKLRVNRRVWHWLFHAPTANVKLNLPRSLILAHTSAVRTTLASQEAQPQQWTDGVACTSGF